MHDLPSGTTDRLDLYREVHKGLRAFLTDTLGRVGRMDPQDPADVVPTLAQVRELLFICGTHLTHEDTFLHRAMEARRPGSTARITHEHLEHTLALRGLEAEAAAVEAAADAAGRGTAALRLYRSLARFVAENLQHMEQEETQNNAVLWAAYTDAELLQLHEALLASIPPPELMVYLRWMLPSISHAERVATLEGLRQGAPAEAFQAVLALTRAQLPARDWTKLAHALGATPAVAA